MLKSIVHEFLGGERPADRVPECLAPLAGRKRVLLIFADAEDDRAMQQDELLRKAPMLLIQEDIEVFSVAGGGVFPVFESSFDLDADEIRDKLQGPDRGRFGLILLGYDGQPLLRSDEPLDIETILKAIESAPKDVSATSRTLP